jgi:hypothetical protein
MGGCIEKFQTRLQEKELFTKQQATSNALQSLDSLYEQTTLVKQQCEKDIGMLEKQIATVQSNPSKKSKHVLKGELTLLVTQKKHKERKYTQTIAEMGLVQAQRELFVMQQQSLNQSRSKEVIMRSAKALHMDLSEHEKKIDQQQEMLEQLQEATQTAYDEMSNMSEQYLNDMGVHDEVEQLLDKASVHSDQKQQQQTTKPSGTVPTQSRGKLLTQKTISERNKKTTTSVLLQE